ncbi:hypothetical protein IW261DRAFT_1424932 [Armillaria novae-zelandiae]|uniref:Transmembrane protein n=1 Tax=Armillaria novae-zelandiae TaxID=153914 RepID=A0AA39U6F1_9AGAR|nr:hypothetical protein IW261DRAFT_1424932 [Armillaria novae-zelandiae]
MHPPPIRLWYRSIIITTITGVTALALFARRPLIHPMWPQFNLSLRIPSNVGSRCPRHGIRGTSLGILKSTDSDVQSLLHQVPARLRIAPMMMNAVGRARATDYVMFSVLPKIEELSNRICCAHLDLEMVLADWQTLATQTKGIMVDLEALMDTLRDILPRAMILQSLRNRLDAVTQPTWGGGEEIEQAVRVRQTTQGHVEKRLHDLQQLFTAIADVVQKLIDFKEACSSVRALALEGAGDALKMCFATRAPALNKEVPLKSR